MCLPTIQRPYMYSHITQLPISSDITPSISSAVHVGQFLCSSRLLLQHWICETFLYFYLLHAQELCGALYICDIARLLYASYLVDVCTIVCYCLIFPYGDIFLLLNFFGTSPYIFDILLIYFCILITSYICGI